MIRKLRDMKMKYKIYADDRDHILSLKNEYKRRYKLGYISKDKLEAKLAKIDKKDARLKEIRKEF
jgi:hypothetical protein